MRLLIRLRPRLIWYQFSWGLGIALWAYALLAPRGAIRLVADVHSKALRRKGTFPFSWLVHAFKRRALHLCAAVIVSNDRDRADAWERFVVTALVLPDPLPDVPASSATGRNPAEAVFVCSFAVDEPMDLMIAVIQRLAGRVRTVVTGNIEAAPQRHREALRRSEARTGFVPESRYWELLGEARAVIVLSTEPGCLPCGAYEAIAVGKRPIIVDDPIARATFGNSARYVTLDPAALEEAVLEAVHENPDPQLRAGYCERWHLRWTGVQSTLATADALPRLVGRQP